jgi:ribosome modulation factor
MKTPLKGWRTWGGDRCDHCCNGDRCDDRTHISRERCPYCLGTGQALWLDQYREAGTDEVKRS